MTTYIHHRADGTLLHTQCDDANDHRVWHNFEVEPRFTPARKQPHTMAADAQLDAVVDKILRNIDTNRKTSPSRTSKMAKRSSPGFDADALFQRDPDSRSYRPGAAPRRHALDEGGPSMSELREAHSNLSEACDGLEELLKDKRFSFDKARGFAKDAAEHAGRIHSMLGGDSGEDDDPAGPGRSANAEGGEDDVGETPARSVVRTGDSALADFDADTLFQKGNHR